MLESLGPPAGGRFRPSVPMVLFALWVLVFLSVFYTRPNYSVVTIGILRWVPVPLPRESFDVREFGAVGDGVTDNTAAFEAAVTAIWRRGGGRLNVSSGVWLTGPFNLTSHMILFLDEGAIILGNKVSGSQGGSSNLNQEGQNCL